MELTLERTIKTGNSTIGQLYIDGLPECLILEDVDRGLTQSMPVSEIMAIKVHGKTAIPSGRYKVIITMSNRFKRLLPLLVNVPGFEGIRIHPGNTSKQTDGCLLPGIITGEDFVSNSRAAFNVLFKKINGTSNCWITIT